MRQYFWMLCLIAGCTAAPAPQQNSDTDNDPTVNEPEPECMDNSDCDDGAYCNGEERCQGGTCRESSRPCGGEACDEAANQCVIAEPEPEPEPEPDPGESGPFYFDFPASALDVFDSCNSGTLIYGENEVVAIILLFEENEALGISYGASIDASIDGCDDRWGFETPDSDSCLACGITAANYAYQNVLTLPPPPPPIVPSGAILIAYDGTFLGNVNSNSFDADSIANSFGTYGNPFRNCFKT